MAVQALTMVCLMLAGDTPALDAKPLNNRSFNIPIRIDPDRRAEISSLQLLVSTDQGRTWNKVVVATPDQPSFGYQAPSDGVYWFSIVVVDREGKQDPPNPFQATPDLKLLVDTLPPQLRIISAERQAEEIVVRWEIVDQHIDLVSLKLQYRTGESANWNPVGINPSVAGQASFRPGTTGAVTVRMEVQDLAQNPASTQAEVPAASKAGYAPAGMNGHSSPGWQPIQDVPQVIVHNPPPRIETPIPGSQGSNHGMASGPHVVASSGAPLNPVVATQPSPATAPPRTQRAPIPPPQVVNTSRVTLDYEVAKFGPSGVGSVELFVTRDDGRNWHPIGGEQNIAAPMPNELQAPAATMRRSLTVELPDDGVYGFYLVVRSGAGRGKPPPQNGIDAPQMRVEVDRQAPEAKLYAPEPAAGRRDALILRWVATDKNLTANPITLQWAPPPDRQQPPNWQTLGTTTELPNTGQYVWQVPPGIPPRVYLRLVVRDTAGNSGVAETQEPILIDLTEPEATIIRVGVSPR